MRLGCTAPFLYSRGEKNASEEDEGGNVEQPVPETRVCGFLRRGIDAKSMDEKAGRPRAATIPDPSQNAPAMIDKTRDAPIGGADHRPAIFNTTQNGLREVLFRFAGTVEPGVVRQSRQKGRPRFRSLASEVGESVLEADKRGEKQGSGFSGVVGRFIPFDAQERRFFPGFAAEARRGESLEKRKLAFKGDIFAERDEMAFVVPFGQGATFVEEISRIVEAGIFFIGTFL